MVIHNWGFTILKTGTLCSRYICSAHSTVSFLSKVLQ
uniref:Uncharacterized protein n=1 Tax=Anguilla anguilla TaxID=7936 RepID=A0A0E9W136_ANGAN